MCMMSAPKVQTKVPPAPTRASVEGKPGLARRAAKMAANSRGIYDAIATSPLGDPGYGSGAGKPTVLGLTSGY